MYLKFGWIKLKDWISNGGILDREEELGLEKGWIIFGGFRRYL